ncbi:hypothetical protein EI42_01136 [Thermosporothrix hazakensis]|jgi:hypothetical protein|uniref:Uncharacterized protein n=1 Tax=Thermosporothrix hazakensis TaxID=644383 RepID=A0A326UCA7_THEHA|nr:hypothetical protein [Thermosporothrix hazakensis]PZW34299.1 hypothetical protein EI42_01136 [Thermosporothrix hazakensis]GCE46149.1 hypothetical protein KTH_10180 [Thermosporothrix hazakensis]
MNPFSHYGRAADPFQALHRECRWKLRKMTLQLWGMLVACGGSLLIYGGVRLISILLRMFQLEAAWMDRLSLLSPVLYSGVLFLGMGWLVYAYFRIPVLQVTPEGIMLALFLRIFIAWTEIERLELQLERGGVYLAIYPRDAEVYLSRFNGPKAWRMRRMLAKTGAPLVISQELLDLRHPLPNIVRDIQDHYAEELRILDPGTDRA